MRNIVTLLAAYQAHGLPVLVGDALCTSTVSRSLRKKVYFISPNLVVGWTGYLITARTVIFELSARFWGKQVTTAELENALCNLSFLGMADFDVKIVGWLIDDQPRAFIWQSSYPKEVFYNAYYFEGSGEQYFESVLKSHIVTGGDPPRTPHKFSKEIAAVQETLVSCGEAFFSEILASEKWQETFGFAYEVLVYAYERFWPLGPTVYVGWQYRWNVATQTGEAVLSPFIAKMNFRQHYSILQKASHNNLRIEKCRNYPIRPVYDCDIKEDLSKLRFNIDADHYVHYFVTNPPVNGQLFRVSYVCGRTQPGDKVTLTFNDGVPCFDVNTTAFDEMFRQGFEAAKTTDISRVK